LLITLTILIKTIMDYWKNFWQNYRIIPINNKNDLLYQVGKTVHKKVIHEDQFQILTQEILDNLDVNKDDNVLDLCCGNGVITYELSKYANYVYGIDFSQPLIKNARKYKSNHNISYLCHDARQLDQISTFLANKGVTKILLYDAIGYLTTHEFVQLLLDVKKIAKPGFVMFIGGVFDKTAIWQFFNTPARKINYFINIKILGKTKAIGKWWPRNKIKTICEHNHFHVEIQDQNEKLYTAYYRFNMKLQEERKNGHNGHKGQLKMPGYKLKTNKSPVEHK